LYKYPTIRCKNNLERSTAPSKEAIILSTENSLKRLGVEQLDALLVHRPDFC
jgi:predicted oxidoreductase